MTATKTAHELMTLNIWANPYRELKRDVIGNPLSLYKQTPEMRKLIETDLQHVQTRVTVYNERTKDFPRTGDFVLHKDGSVTRFTRVFDGGAQTGGTQFGEGFYMGSDGNISYSGGLDPSINFKDMILTDETRIGRFWFPSGNWLRASCRIVFDTECRVYKEV